MPLVPPYIEALRPYEAGRRLEEVRREYGLARVAKLASNENPLGPSPLAREALCRQLECLHLYPNGGLDLRAVLAREYDLKLENVIVGSGSEGIMSNIIRAFLCDEDEVLTTEAAFIGFQVLARSRGVRYRTVPYRDWHYDLEAIAAAINEHTKIIYLANPMKAGERARENDIAAAAATVLGAAFRPREVHLVPELPKTQSGKVVRRRIRQKYLGEELGELSTVANPGALEHFSTPNPISGH